MKKNRRILTSAIKIDGETQEIRRPVAILPKSHKSFNHNGLLIMPQDAF